MLGRGAAQNDSSERRKMGVVLQWILKLSEYRASAQESSGRIYGYDVGTSD